MSSRTVLLAVIGWLAAATRVGADPEGVPLCTAAGFQDGVDGCADGSGGAFFVWVDRRGTDADLYASRLDASGARAPGWPAEGVPLCTVAGDQTEPRIAFDGVGGALVVWQDGRDGAADLYAQRLTRDATLGFGWDVRGVPVCTAPGVQADVGIVPDGVGGGFIVWADYRSGPNADIYATWLRASGRLDAHWPAGGEAICSSIGRQSAVAAIADGQNNVIVVWEDYRSGSTADLYAQRFTSTGFRLWDAGGVPVCTAPGDQQRPDVVPDGTGGALVVWQDLRLLDYDVYAQRLRPDGSIPFAWGEQGRPITTAGGSQLFPRLVSDGTGGALVTWADLRNGSSFDLYAQHFRIDAAIETGWPLEGAPICTAIGDQLFPEIVTDAQGGGIVGWTDRRVGAASDIYATRVTLRGETGACWPTNGLPVSRADFEQEGVTAVADGRGGALLAWTDWRSGSSSDIYARRAVATDAAAAQWPPGGVRLCGATGDQGSGDAPGRRANAVADGAGGAFVAWHDRRSDSGDIYVQHVRYDGQVAEGWPEDGVAASRAPGLQDLPAVAPDGAGGVFVVWQDSRDAVSPGAAWDIYANRIASGGSVYAGWPLDGVAVCAVQGDQYFPRAAADGSGGALFFWQDFRNGYDFDVYAVRLTGAGTLGPGWPLWGRTVGATGGDQVAPRAVASEFGGAIVTWMDRRSGTGFDVLALALNIAGNPRIGWSAEGSVVSAASGDQFAPSLVSDGAGGAVLAWRDRRAGIDELYATKLLSSGALAPGWTSGGVAVVAGGTGVAVDFDLASDWEGGAVFAWSDRRAGGFEAYAQRITAGGARHTSWPANGARLGEGSSLQFEISAAPDHSGGALVCWTDPSQGGQMRAQHVGPRGSLTSGWPRAGALVGATGNAPASPTIVTDTAGCALVVWHARSQGADFDVYAHRVVPDRGPASSAPIPTVLRLDVWPNPASGAVQVRFALAQPARMRLEVFDVHGRRVQLLTTPDLPLGEHALVWDGRLADRDRAPRGTYFLRLSGPGYEATSKLVRSR